MIKEYTSLGLMSGTSGDGVDASVLKSDGKKQYKVLLDRFFPYNKDLKDDIFRLRDYINRFSDLKKYLKEINLLEEKITLFHAMMSGEILKEYDIDIVGFHGQTIYHNAKEKITRQLGDGKKLSRILKKNLVYNFRQNDINNNGEGAPLTPIYHKLIANDKKIDLPVSILNIGGISNLTSINFDNKMTSSDIGPGNCLIDNWIRINSENSFDIDGKISSSGKINEIILEQALDFFYNSSLSKNKSYDIKDFDISFARGLSLEDGAATLTEFTSKIISQKIFDKVIYVCGGGRKNKFLMKSIQNKIKGKIFLIDNLNVKGDFIESQAFAYMAIRSFLSLPISFPETTGCKKPTIGGDVINF